jgi:hypothetical protein
LQCFFTATSETKKRNKLHAKEDCMAGKVIILRKMGWTGYASKRMRREINIKNIKKNTT